MRSKRKRPGEPDPMRARVVFDVVDDEHIRVRVEWPPGSNVTTLGIALGIINSGKMIEQQMKSIAGYASEIGDPGAATFLCNILQQMTNPTTDEDRPLIMPTEVIGRQLRMREG